MWFNGTTAGRLHNLSERAKVPQYRVNGLGRVHLVISVLSWLVTYSGFVAVVVKLAGMLDDREKEGSDGRRNAFSEAPLHTAISQGHSRCVKVRSSSGVSSEVRPTGRRCSPTFHNTETPLRKGCRHGRWKRTCPVGLSV